MNNVTQLHLPERLLRVQAGISELVLEGWAFFLPGLGQREECPILSASKLHAGRVGADSIKPRRGMRTALKLRDMRESGKQSVLDGILCIFTIAESAKRRRYNTGE